MTKKKLVPKTSPSLNTKKHTAQNGRMSTVGRITVDGDGGANQKIADGVNNIVKTIGRGFEYGVFGLTHPIINNIPGIHKIEFPTWTLYNLNEDFIEQVQPGEYYTHPYTHEYVQKPYPPTALTVTATPTPVNWLKLYQGVAATTKVSNATKTREGLMKFKKAVNADDRFIGGQAVINAIEESPELSKLVGHGIAKGTEQEALASARTLLRYGSDPNRFFHTGALSKIDRTAGAALGTAGGKPYSHGPFILLTKPGVNTAQPGAFSHILINSGDETVEALELANKYKQALLSEFPNVKVMLYNEVPGYLVIKSKFGGK